MENIQIVVGIAMIGRLKKVIVPVSGHIIIPVNLNRNQNAKEIDMAEIDENTRANKQRAELFTQALEEFVLAMIVNHGSPHIEDAVTQNEKRAAFVQALLDV